MCVLHESDIIAKGERSLCKVEYIRPVKRGAVSSHIPLYLDKDAPFGMKALA